MNSKLVVKLDLEKIINELSKKRPVFHSEADFQFSLAWEIKLNYENAKIILEKPISINNDDKHSYLDVFVSLNGVNYAIELKYKTTKLIDVINEEKFYLLNQAAQNLGKYDFIKDIFRLEEFKKKHCMDICYAIMITNDSLYWKKTKQENVTASQFNLYEGRLLDKGEHKWNLKNGQEIKGGRDKSIILDNKYPLAWKNYSNDGQFKYLFLTI